MAADIFKLVGLGADAVGISKAALLSINYDPKKFRNDSNESNFDQDKTNEVLELRDAFITQGYMGADALQKSVDLLTGKKPAATVDEVQQQVAEKKKVANTTKKIQAAESQPPAMKGKNKVDKKVDINSMSIDEFDALPAETLKRMRGDFG